MPDIIHLLPETVSNQIAAGEVIQRPASAVKELLENAIDAGATEVSLILKDAGRTLLQVVDNGSGMSPTDARMCFERHATSKIKSADELFCIRTKGFRGEAMASIASIAHVEMKTRLHGEPLATNIEIEGGKIIRQENCAASEGSSISVKHLFFNVPARRNFLKSNPVELRHVVDEFHRIALAHPGVAFNFNHNGSEMFRLAPGHLRQRLVSLFGKNFNEKLVPVEEETSILNLTGFICKPEFAKKTRGEQFFFVNNRYIRDGYLHHAVVNAYEGLLPPGTHPSYFLFIEIDPSHIDVNIHPTKTEIKFDDDRSVYAILRSAVKRSLGQYSISPSLDFDQEQSVNVPLMPKGYIPPTPKINVDPTYNPFREEKPYKPIQTRNWETLMAGLESTPVRNETVPSLIEQEDDEMEFRDQPNTFQILGKFIVTPVKSGLMIIDQCLAHERILYEKFRHALEQGQAVSQQQLFPKTIELSASESIVVLEIMEDLQHMGIDIREFGKNSFVIQGMPVELAQKDEKEVLEELIEAFTMSGQANKGQRTEHLARAMAVSSSIKSGRNLDQLEMRKLVNELFACQDPYHSPGGKTILNIMDKTEIMSRLGQ